VWLTLGVGAAVAGAAWVVVMVGLLASNDRLGLARAARNLFRVAVGVTAVVAVYAVAVPAVVWAMARLTWAAGVESPVPAASLTAVVTTLLTWFGAPASTMWRRTERLAAGGGKVGPLRWLLGRRGQGEVVEQQVATGLGQRLIVWAVHAVLTFVFVFMAAWTTAAAHRWPAWVGLALLAVLVVAGPRGSRRSSSWARPPCRASPGPRRAAARPRSPCRPTTSAGPTWAGSRPAPSRRPASRPCAGT
jgi:hypothetical protein